MLFDAPEVCKWNKDRHAVLNVLGVVGYIVYVVLAIGCIILFSFISAIFGLAAKS